MNINIIGEKFNNDKLEAIGLSDNRSKNGARYILCRCSECAKDTELFGEGIFEAQKGNLIRNKIPCGCSTKYAWNKDQNKIRLDRISSGRYLTKHEDLIRTNVDVTCVCLYCEHEWTATLSKLLSGTGCIKCGQFNTNAVENIMNECEVSGSKFNGFIGEIYRGAFTRLDICCGCGNTWTPTYNEFVNKHRSICSKCKNPTYGYSENKPGTLYVVFWENDFSCFVKYGISNRFKERLIDQMRNTDFIPTILFSVEFDGKTTKELEFEIDTIRTRLYGNRGFIHKDLFPDGYTETISYNDLDQINDLIYSLTLCRINK